MIKQMPLSLGNAQKSDVRTQFAALCYRLSNGRVEILMITSRRSGRWILPKGWPMDGKTPADSARAEAWEEAGVIGRSEPGPIGLFSYTKSRGKGVSLPCVAMVYPIRVKSLSDDYPERKLRRRKWMTRKKAAAVVAEPELARLLRGFDPRLFR